MGSGESHSKPLSGLLLLGNPYRCCIEGIEIVCPIQTCERLLKHIEIFITPRRDVPDDHLAAETRSHQSIQINLMRICGTVFLPIRRVATLRLASFVPEDGAARAAKALFRWSSAWNQFATFVNNAGQMFSCCRGSCVWFPLGDAP